ncbi:DUF3857 domain-containing protein [Frigoriflavimonas asaccharolytica]|uniref:DUF3857 domain-containing protein n=1 Tax=Frigoriflavimonas asaccharolytica TaxID=2735899 RepID=A0A8J8GAH1_9FLAO|nr:DUF3857 domain-containing protein [Frigoriflavimonas asaccharolytica]NRS93921.1 hypothetical protein [Frigoriflavimonas asaccharolytica]
MKNLYLIFSLILGSLFHSQDIKISSISADLQKNAYAVVRNHSEIYTINSVNDMEISEETTISILSSSGDEFGAIGIPYNPYSKINDVKVFVFDKDGKEIKKYAKKDFTDVSHNPSNALYVDDRILFLRPLVHTYPYTIKYSYITKTSNTAYLNYFRPLQNFNLAVENSEIIIENKSGIILNTKISDTFLAKVKSSISGTTSKYFYENIAAIESEQLTPSIDFLVPNIDFALQKFSLAGNIGDNSNWNTLGKWYYEKLISPQSAITPEIKKEIEGLKLTGTTSEKVKKIYQYMQSKTHYILVTMGIGGWQPMEAEDVRKKGYGDCKALTNYMRTLLAAADIPSYFCVINDNPSAKSYDPNFIELSGNHAILMIPTEKDPIWLENTSQNIAYNHLNYTSHYRNVLAVSEKGIELINTPIYQPKDSKEVLKSKVKIQENNGISVVSNFKFSGGQYDLNIPLFYYNAVDLKQAVKNKHGNLKIEKMEVINLKNNRDIAEIDYDLAFEAADYSKKLGNDIFFRVMPFYSVTIMENGEERKLPFETAFPYEDDYEVEFDIPAGYQFSEIPKNQELKSEFGNYTISFGNANGKLQVRRVLSINRGTYPKEKYQNYVDFRKKAANFDSTKVLITKL